MNLLVLQNGRNQLFFRMKHCDEIKKLLLAFSEKRAWDYVSTLYSISGYPFDHDQTPEDVSSSFLVFAYDVLCFLSIDVNSVSVTKLLIKKVELCKTIIIVDCKW